MLKCVLDLILPEQHVWDALTDGELPATLRTLELPLNNLHFHHHVVGSFQEWLIALVLVGQGLRQLCPMTKLGKTTRLVEVYNSL